MDLGVAGWGLQWIIAAFILGAVVFWAVLRNRGTKVDPDITERATHDLYDQEEAARRRDDGEV